MSPNTDQQQAAAEFMAAQLHPLDQRGRYCWHVRVKAKSGALFYLLQALSFALTSVCFGLITNYLYDVAKEKFGKKPIDVDPLLTAYQKRIEELRAHLASAELEQRKLDRAQEWVRFHEETILRMKEQDPEIIAAVSEAICQMETRGSSSLADEVTANAKIPS